MSGFFDGNQARRRLASWLRRLALTVEPEGRARLELVEPYLTRSSGSSSNVTFRRTSG